MIKKPEVIFARLCELGLAALSDSVAVVFIGVHCRSVEMSLVDGAPAAAAAAAAVEDRYGGVGVNRQVEGVSCLIFLCSLCGHVACVRVGAGGAPAEDEVDEEFERFLKSVTWDGADEQLYKAVVKSLAENGVKRVAHLDGLEMGFLRFDVAPRGTTLG